MISQLRNLFRRKDTVYVFDIDGVLAAFEYGEHNHNFCGEKEWAEMNEYIDVYGKARPLKILQKFIAKRLDRCYVCSWETNDIFKKQKLDFVCINYGIDPSHVYFVNNNEEKVLIMRKIHYSFYTDLSPRYICIVDDSTSVLTHVQDISCYTTIHISTFLK